MSKDETVFFTFTVNSVFKINKGIDNEREHMQPMDDCECESACTNSLDIVNTQHEQMSCCSSSSSPSLVSLITSSSSLSNASLANTNDMLSTNKICPMDLDQHNGNNTNITSDNLTTDVVMGVASDELLNDYDIKILIDLFYLPFDYGPFGVYLLKEFDWLRLNLNLMNHVDSVRCLAKLIFFTLMHCHLMSFAFY
jgi:hypothetical protein